jgi:signal peptidase II
MDKKIALYQHRNLIRIVLLLFMITLNISCDQISKNIVRNDIAYGETVSVIKDRFILTKVENTGAFLSAGNELPKAVRFTLLTVLPILVLAYGLFYLLYKINLPKTMQIGLCFLIGGGIGNIYDRILYGSVTDFMHMDFGIFRTGVFNFADVSIMVGIGILFVVSFKKKIIKPVEEQPA